MTKQEAYQQGWRDGEASGLRSAATLAAGHKQAAEALRANLSQAAKELDEAPQADEMMVLIEVVERLTAATERLTATIMRDQGLDPDATEGEE